MSLDDSKTHVKFPRPKREIPTKKTPNTKKSGQKIEPDNTKLEKYPDVIVDFEYNDGLLSIVIENIGNEPAYDTAIRFNKKIWGMQKTKDISSLEIFRSLKFLPPGKKINILVDSFQSYLLHKQPMNVSVHVLFRSKAKQTFQNVIQHNLSIYKDLPRTVTSGFD